MITITRDNNNKHTNNAATLDDETLVTRGNLTAALVNYNKIADDYFTNKWENSNTVYISDTSADQPVKQITANNLRLINNSTFFVYLNNSNTSQRQLYLEVTTNSYINNIDGNDGINSNIAIRTTASTYGNGSIGYKATIKLNGNNTLINSNSSSGSNSFLAKGLYKVTYHTDTTSSYFNFNAVTESAYLRKTTDYLSNTNANCFIPIAGPLYLNSADEINGTSATAQLMWDSNVKYNPATQELFSPKLKASNTSLIASSTTNAVPKFSNDTGEVSNTSVLISGAGNNIVQADIYNATSAVNTASLAVTNTAAIGSLDVKTNATVSNTLTVTNTLSVSNGAATFGSTLYANSTTTLASTLYASGAATFANTLWATGAATFASTLYASGAATFANTLWATGAATFASTLYASGAATFANTLWATGAATFASTLYASNSVKFDDTLDVASTSTFGGTLYVSGAATFEGDLWATGAATFASTLYASGAATLASTVNFPNLKAASGPALLMIDSNGAVGKSSSTTRTNALIYIDANGSIAQNTEDIGSLVRPVYYHGSKTTSDGGTNIPQFEEIATYAGGTLVTLNGTGCGGSTAGFFAPTAAGSAGQILVSSEGAPGWKTIKVSLNDDDTNTTNATNKTPITDLSFSITTNADEVTITLSITRGDLVVPASGTATNALYYSE